MFSTELSWFLQWLISNTVIAGCIAIVALIAERWWKRPGLAHLLWVLVLVKLGTPPLLHLPVPINANQFSWLLTERSIGEIPDWQDRQRASSIHQAFGVTTASESKKISWSNWLTTLWAIGALALGWWIVSTGRRFAHLVRRNGQHDLAASQRVRELMISPGPFTPPVWMVDAVVSPMLVGVGKRAKIIFPRALWNRLDQKSRDSLLMHELEHWRRRDGIVRYIETVAWVLLWWHPLLWIARKQIEACEERCCDFAVSSRSEMLPKQYAEAILTTLDFLAEPDDTAFPRSSPVASPLGKLPQLERRLRDIMCSDAIPALGHRGRLLLLAVIATLPIQLAIVFTR